MHHRGEAQFCHTVNSHAVTAVALKILSVLKLTRIYINVICSPCRSHVMKMTNVLQTGCKKACLPE